MPKRFRIFAIIAILAAAVILRAGFFHASTTHVNISGDESIAALMAMGITQPSDSPVMQAKQHPRGIFGRFPLLFMAQPYLFPVDSYLAAPFVRWLPKTAAGIRFTPLLLGLLTVGLSIAIMLLGGGLRRSWPGVLLALFPSAYLLLLQGAYGLPGYPSSMFLAAFTIFVAVMHKRAEKTTAVVLLAMLAGIGSGVACSGTLLMLPLILGVGAMVCLATNWKKALLSAPAFAIGVALGLAPYLIAKHIYPGAHEAVSQTVSVGEALARLWKPTLTFTLPAAMGINPPIIPDSVETISMLPKWAGSAFAILWLAIMLAASIVCLWKFIQRTIKNRWPSITVTDICVLISWLSLGLFIMTTRWGSCEFRYLMPAAWCLPFVIAALYSAARHRWLTSTIGTIALLLTLINAAAAIGIARYWSAESFDGYFTDVKPAVEYLQQRGINHCYSSYFDAYVIDYVTDEKIVCSQPYNERFYGWPLPYKELVDGSTNAAYVLGPSRRFMPEHFKADLEFAGVTSKLTHRGRFDIHTDFHNPLKVSETLIPSNQITFSTDDNPEEAARLNDGNRASRWQSHKAQYKEMKIDIKLASPQPVRRITFYYDYYPYDNANAINILSIGGNATNAVTNSVAFEMQPFEFINNHPVYGSQFQTIRFPPVTTDHLRIEIAEPHSGRDWTIGEIQLYR